MEPDHDAMTPSLEILMANLAEPPSTSRVQLKPDGRPNVSAELARLKFDISQNKALRRLPRSTQIERRPLLHPPVASPYVGKHVPKCVYVSRNTPVMAAVKRVRKLLSHVEKRAMQGVDLAADPKGGMKKLAEVNDKLAKDGEKVYVKASGRAMEQALRIAEWFRRHEREVGCDVEVKTGSVQAIDDLVDGSEGVADGEEDKENNVNDGTFATMDETPELVDTSLLTNDSDVVPAKMTGADEQEASKERGEEPVTKKRRRQKRKRKQYDADEVPEARIRWIKTIEIAVSLKG